MKQDFDDIIWLLWKDLGTLTKELWHTPESAAREIDNVLHSTGERTDNAIAGILQANNVDWYRHLVPKSDPTVMYLTVLESRFRDLYSELKKTQNIVVAPEHILIAWIEIKRKNEEADLVWDNADLFKNANWKTLWKWSRAMEYAEHQKWHRCPTSGELKKIFDAIPWLSPEECSENAIRILDLTLEWSAFHDSCIGKTEYIWASDRCQICTWNPPYYYMITKYKEPRLMYLSMDFKASLRLIKNFARGSHAAVEKAAVILKSHRDDQMKLFWDEIIKTGNIDVTIWDSCFTALMYASFYWFTELIGAMLHWWADPFQLDFWAKSNSYDLAKGAWNKDASAILKKFMLENMPDNILQDSWEIKDYLEFKYDVTIWDIHNFCNFPDWTLGWIVRLDDWMKLPFAKDKLIREIWNKAIDDCRDVHIDEKGILCWKVKLTWGENWFHFIWDELTWEVGQKLKFGGRNVFLK
ncbi:MAG: hypothetical protein ACD_2C00027G0015 [uncultured bacterium (gcode 4)]|uniref:Uncharacterized protein n=1 Tax=uncultured bacterium (gcode 4) TaxID=1234023 RepID=K2G788_9BACT|nr:MAG: hypothetical protein ACD_2C00027G0015 [uncultured bacterium (gcode 4)]